MAQLRPSRLLGGLTSIARVLATADSRAPLRTSLALTRGTGAPTFTRATTATVIDHEGVLRTALAGEARFTGARRVQNLWGGPSATLAVAASNTMTLPAGSYIFSMGAGVGTATFSGTGGATGSLAAGTGRASVLKTISAGTLIVTGSIATLIDLQIEDVTAQSIQTAGEYVSVGVLSSPYHGTGVDGVKCFDTDLSGNVISSSTLKGCLAEGARTNHFKTSAVPATQTSASLSTGTYTLWMDGTGSIAVAGATATITGAGTANASTAITFTVTVAGTVTYTVTGSPTRAQSENGPTRTSYIDVPSTSAVTRNADVLTYPSAGNISDTAGTSYVEFSAQGVTGLTQQVLARDTNGRFPYINSFPDRTQLYDGTTQNNATAGASFINSTQKSAQSWGGGTKSISYAGTAVISSAYDGTQGSGAIAIGCNNTGTENLGGNIADVCIWTRKLPDAILKRISK